MNACRRFAAAALLLLAACGPSTPEGPPPDRAGAFEGAWHGTLSIAGQSLRLELVLETTPDGVEGVLVSLDQGGAEIPLTALTLDADAISFAASRPGLSFEGSRTGDTIDGRFSQSVMRVPLQFERGRFEAVQPADPRATGRLDSEEAPFTVSAGPVSLSGVLRQPVDPLAAVVILSGSGPQDRNGTFGPHQVYAALAEALAAQGVASLRLDDRGVGASTGPAPDAPSDLAADAAAALRALRDETGIRCAGFAGHSEGGLIALMAAPQARPDFIVSLAGMHMSMEQTLRDQSEALIRAAGGGDAQVAANCDLQEAAFTVLRETEPGGDAVAAMRTALIEAGAPDALADQQARGFGQPYSVASFHVDPERAAASYDGPVLGVFAQFDRQVLPEPQSEALRASRPGLTTEIVILPGVNHLFQETETGSAQEYASPDHPVSADALAAIAQRTAALAMQACSD